MILTKLLFLMIWKWSSVIKIFQTKEVESYSRLYNLPLQTVKRRIVVWPKVTGPASSLSFSVDDLTFFFFYPASSFWNSKRIRRKQISKQKPKKKYLRIEYFWGRCHFTSFKNKKKWDTKVFYFQKKFSSAKKFRWIKEFLFREKKLEVSRL